MQFTIGYLGNQSEYNPGSGPGSMETLQTEGLVAMNISIFLPPEVFINRTTPNIGLLYTYYQSASLFPIRRRFKNDKIFVASPVVGASLAEMEEVFSLPEPIILILPVTVVGVLKYTNFLDTPIHHSYMFHM